MKEQILTQAWDKTFPEDTNVSHRKITFHNRYGITLAGDLYTPILTQAPLPALAVCGPFGAVKEQASGLYAQTMAGRGFLTLAFDPSFTGESGGETRYVTSPDISTEDFQAAVDFLSVQENVDPEQIGIIGICGWGAIALSAASLDTRIKATVSATMYDMTPFMQLGATDPEDRQKRLTALNAQRTADYRAGTCSRTGGYPETLPENAPEVMRDFFDYYRGRAYHPRSLNSTDGWNITGSMSWLNLPLLQYIDQIRSAVLLVHGDRAHSCAYSRDVFRRLQGDNKELYLIPGAVHTDLYDQTDIIPFDKIESFFRTYLSPA